MSMTESRPERLSDAERRWLLELARTAIEARLAGAPAPEPNPAQGPLTEPRGAFVTLSREGVLRGCIGHVIGADPLWLSVRTNAINAAFHDPRFPAVAADELVGLALEISALTPLRPVSNAAEVVVGRDGLVVERGTHRGLLLPQVAERYGWSAEEFLDQTCRKAGMPKGCWRSPDARIAAFSAEVFGEDDRA
jgi:AmmeMemoRadiSam system protein A